LRDGKSIDIGPFARAWNLARFRIPLFVEEFENWKNGPVCWELLRLQSEKFVITTNDCPGEFLLNDESLSELIDKEEPWKLTIQHALIPQKLKKSYCSSQSDEK
jgi:uncharacterized phage-associated protein